MSPRRGRGRCSCTRSTPGRTAEIHSPCIAVSPERVHEPHPTAARLVALDVDRVGGLHRSAGRELAIPALEPHGHPAVGALDDGAAAVGQAGEQLAPGHRVAAARENRRWRSRSAVGPAGTSRNDEPPFATLAAPRRARRSTCSPVHFSMSMTADAHSQSSHFVSFVSVTKWGVGLSRSGAGGRTRCGSRASATGAARASEQDAREQRPDGVSGRGGRTVELTEGLHDSRGISIDAGVSSGAATSDSVTVAAGSWTDFRYRPTRSLC